MDEMDVDVKVDEDKSNFGPPQGLSPSAIGQLIASAVVLLPVIGFVGTSMSLYLNRRVRDYGAFSVALDHSVPWLAWHGAIPFVAIGFLGLGALTGSTLGRATIRNSHSESQSVASRRIRIIVALCLGTSLLLVALVFINFFIGSMAIVMSPLFGWAMLRRNSSGRSSFPRLWLPLAILAIASTITVAVIPSPLVTGLVTFSNGTIVPNGSYAILGTDGSQTFLLPCAKNAPLVSVNSASLLSVVYDVGSNASPFMGLYQIVRGGKWPSPGAIVSCPVPK